MLHADAALQLLLLLSQHTATVSLLFPRLLQILFPLMLIVATACCQFTFCYFSEYSCNLLHTCLFLMVLISYFLLLLVVQCVASASSCCVSCSNMYTHNTNTEDSSVRREETNIYLKQYHLGKETVQGRSLETLANFSRVQNSKTFGLAGDM